MSDLFSVFKLKFRNPLFVILIILFLPHLARGTECVYARDTGTVFRIVVPARPDLTIDNQYNNTITSQRAAWIDTRLYTSGDPFYFEIEGMWSPWSATFDLLGGDSQENRDFYRGLQAKTADAFFCNITTKNKGVEKFDANGEFDYISSIMDVNGTSSPYSVMLKPPYVQNTCWLTAGEGLYIGFFGATGDFLPSLATHLKTADILCDSQYLLDNNNDGIITINECVRNNRCYKVSGSCPDENDKNDRTNMAYYTIGGARCERDFYHKTSGLPIGAIGINDCYQEILTESGFIKMDKTLFIFDASFLYKNPQKEKVRKNERIKFVIYDRYYSDNVGQYIINMYGGITDNSDKGLIEKIIEDLEKLFLGARDDSGVLSGGYLTAFYNYLVVDSNFNFIVRAAIIFYMTFLGFSFALGSLEYKTKELMNILLKLTFALAFTTSTSWEIYDKYIIKFFYDGFSSIISMLGNISLLISDDTATISKSAGMASKFAFIDNIILSLFSDSITKKILGLFFGVWYGFIVIPVIYILIIYYIFQLINAIFPYVVMFIQVILGLFVGPIFIVFSLFKTTEFMFKGWLNFVGGRFANMMFLFLGIFVFWAIIQAQFNALLFFNSCKETIIGGDAGKAMDFFSFNLYVWKANWDNLPAGHSTPSFFSFCLSLLFLYVTIYLFGIVMKKIPTIVDSIFAINDERAGGGLDRSGESRLGARIGGFFDNVNKSIRVGTGVYKNGKEERKGIFDYLGSKTRGYVSKGAAKTGGAIWSIATAPVRSGYNSARSYLTGKESRDESKGEGLKGKYAIDNAVSRYEDKLRQQGYSEYDIKEKSLRFREDMSRYFLKDAREAVSKEYDRLSKLYDATAERTGLTPSASEKAQMIKEHLDSYIKSNFDGSFDGKTGYYSTSMRLSLTGSAGDTSLSAEQASRFSRELSLQEKSDRYGITFASFDDYQKHLDRRIEELRTAGDSAWKALAQEKYWTAVEEAGRLQVELGEKAQALKESSEKMKKESEDRKKAVREELEREKEKVDKLNKADATEKEKEILRLTEERIKELEAKIKLQEQVDKQKQVEKALEEERAKVAAIKEEIDKLKDKNADTKTEEELLRLGKERIDLLETRLKLQKEEEEQKKIEEARLKLQKEEEEQRKREEAIRKELEEERAKITSLKAEIEKMRAEGANPDEIARKEAELRGLEAGIAPLEAKLREEEEKRRKIQEKKLALEERTRELERDLTETGKVKLQIDREVSKIEQIRKEIKALKSDPVADPSKILAKEEELRTAEDKVRKFNKELIEILTQENARTEESIGKAETRTKELKDKIREMKSELSGDSANADLEIAIHREENKLKLLEEYTAELRVQLSEQSHEILLRSSLDLEQQLGTAISSAEKTDADVNQYKQTHQDENFALQGINSETFGVQGISTLGLGEDNKDPLGFGRGAAAAVMTDSFSPQGADMSASEEDNYKRLYEENRIRMEKQEAKVLKYKMGLATTSESEKGMLDQQVKEIEKEIDRREARLKD